MSTNTLVTRLILKNDTAANLVTKNPVLLKGECGVEIDTGKFKFGDGITDWNNLLYGGIPTIQKNGVDIVPDANRKINVIVPVTASDVNAVSTNASQGLTTQQKSDARTNIGLGTSATYNVAATGNASTSEVVKGDDTRLSDTRTPTDNTVSTAKIVNDAVDNTKLATMPTNTLKGNNTAATANVKDLTVTEVKTLLGVSAASGIAPLDANSLVPVVNIPSLGNITNAGKIGVSANLPLITGTGGLIQTGSFGNAANTFTEGNDSRLSDTRTPTDNTVTTAKIVDANVTTAKIADANVTNAKLANMAAYTIKGNNASTPGAPVDLTVAQTKTLLGAGANNGLATLDSTGKVPSTQLPSYVDDIIEVVNYAALPATGVSGVMYITLDTNKVYRWANSVYVEVANALDYATQLEAEGGTENTKVMTALRTAQAITAQAVKSVKINSGTELKDATGNVNLKAYPVVDNSTLANTAGAGTAADTFKVKDSGITATQLASSAVTTTKINDLAVTNAKIDSMNFLKLTQTAGDYLILDCGTATL